MPRVRCSSPITLLHTCFRPTPLYAGPTVAVAISAGEACLSTQVDAAWGAVNVKGGVFDEGLVEADGAPRDGVPRQSAAWTQQISMLDLCLRVRMRSATMDGERKFLLAPVTVVAAMEQQRTALATTVDVSPICLYLSYRQLEALRYAFFIERGGSSAALRRARRFARRRGAPPRPSASAALELKQSGAAQIANPTPWLQTDTSLSVRAPEVIVTVSLVDVPSLPLRSSQMVRARIDTFSLSRTTTFARRALPRGAEGSAGAGAGGAQGATARTALSVSVHDVEVCEVTRPTLPALPSEALRHIYRFIKQRRHTPLPSPRAAPLSSRCDGGSAAAAAAATATTATTTDAELSEEEDVDGNDGCGWSWRSIGFFLLRAQQGQVRGACLDPLQATPVDGAPSQVPLPLLVTAVGSEHGERSVVYLFCLLRCSLFANLFSLLIFSSSPAAYSIATGRSSRAKQHRTQRAASRRLRRRSNRSTSLCAFTRSKRSRRSRHVPGRSRRRRRPRLDRDDVRRDYRSCSSTPS